MTDLDKQLRDAQNIMPRMGPPPASFYPQATFEAFAVAEAASLRADDALADAELAVGDVQGASAAYERDYAEFLAGNGEQPEEPNLSDLRDRASFAISRYSAAARAAASAVRRYSALAEHPATLEAMVRNVTEELAPALEDVRRRYADFAHAARQWNALKEAATEGMWKLKLRPDCNNAYVDAQAQTAWQGLDAWGNFLGSESDITSGAWIERVLNKAEETGSE